MRIASIVMVALVLGPLVGMAHAQITGNVIKVGVLNDQSSLYADIVGPGSVLAARMAVEDVGGKVAGAAVEVVFADHQNKPDVGTSIARQWFDRDGVDAVVDVGTSSVALAVNEVVREKNKVHLNTSAATSDLTGKACSPNTVHWVYDTWALANGTGKAVLKAGGDSWFFLTADYAFGHVLERDVSNVVKANGGKVLGSVRHPLNTADFSSFLLQAQGSKAKIIGLANAGGDTTNAIKQAAEFGIVKAGQKLAGLLVFITDIHALGIRSAQGLQFTEAFYWDLNDQTRAWSKRFAQKHSGKMPTSAQAGVYSTVAHYLKAVAQTKSDGDGKAVVAKMKELPTDDPIFGKGTVREDGRKIHPMYLFEVKSPDQSKGAWDYYKLVATIPAAEAFRPLDQGDCPLVKKK
jgi:branched-chain amino acid transport system substrate-binding protein